MSSEERSWILISKAVSGEISAAEREEMEMIFLSHPDLRSDYEHLKNVKILSANSPSPDERKAMENGLKKFSQLLSAETEPTKQGLNHIYSGWFFPGRLYSRWLLAASIAAILIVIVFKYNFMAEKPAMKQLVTAQYGKRVHMLLPDGSNVWLNSGSSIKFADNLNLNGKREIILNGEAYFDVKHDVKHPFIVHAGKLNVVVLGTAFNVKAYGSDNFVETTLIRGKVEILNDAKPGSPIILKPDQKVSISTGSSMVKTIAIKKKTSRDSVITRATTGLGKLVLPDEDITETAWVSNKLTFKKENFTELARQLERWYNVRIVFDNNLYKAKQFTGTFKDQDIDEVMHALQLTQPFHFTITDNQIHIW